MSRRDDIFSAFLRASQIAICEFENQLHKKATKLYVGRQEYVAIKQFCLVYGVKSAPVMRPEFLGCKVFLVDDDSHLAVA